MKISSSSHKKETTATVFSSICSSAGISKRLINQSNKLLISTGIRTRFHRNMAHVQNHHRTNQRPYEWSSLHFDLLLLLMPQGWVSGWLRRCRLVFQVSALRLYRDWPTPNNASDRLNSTRTTDTRSIDDGARSFRLICPMDRELRVAIAGRELRTTGLISFRSSWSEGTGRLAVCCRRD